MYVDTIAAVSSPPGSSARGIVRLSGPRAVEAARSCFCPDDASSWDDSPGQARLEGRLRLGPALELPAAVFLFRAPRSYTREDVVEFHLPGSPGLLALLTDALLGAGVRPAEPGEFTARALHHGALDLTRAEGVAELIHARSDGQLRAARRLLEGALARDADAARDELDDLRALVEAALDFADEDIEFIPRDELVLRLRSVAARLRVAAASDERVERLAEPPRIVLAGPPNAGKSTLMNRLTGLDRAICSPLAGTTRDVLCAAIALPHGEALLCDTAGIFHGDVVAGQAENRRLLDAAAPSAGALAQRADEAARRAIESADVVVWVTALDEPVASPPQHMWLVVGNKRDAVTDERAATAAEVLARRCGAAPLLIRPALKKYGLRRPLFSV